MLRWALRAPIDTRSSMLHLMGHSPSLQLLSQKSCVRFFHSLERHPRFASQFVEKVRAGIDWDLLGRSTLTWWPLVEGLHGVMGNTKPLYKAFREMIRRDLVGS